MAPANSQHDNLTTIRAGSRISGIRSLSCTVAVVEATWTLENHCRTSQTLVRRRAEMDGIRSKQTLNVQALKRIVTNYKKDSMSRKTLTYLNRKLQLLEELKNEAVGLHQEAVKLLTGVPNELEHPYFKNNLFGKFEDDVDELIVDIESIKAEIERNEQKVEESIVCQVSESEVKLPRIALPTFAGDYASWISFRDLFTSLIHNKKNLSSVEKLHYLKSSLCGEPAKLLNQFAITEANYIPAWKVLNDRFDNKNVLLRSQFKRLSNMKCASESASSIKSLLDNTVECLQTIDNLHVNNLWDAFVVHLTAERLPVMSRQQWEQEQSSRKLTSFEDMKSFLTNRFRVLEASVSNERQVVRSQVNVLRATDESVCAVCNENHTVYKCKQFIEYTYSDRFTAVKKHGLCLNCLRKGHIVAHCPSLSRCTHCKKAHHTLLHRQESTSNSLEPSQHVNMLNTSAVSTCYINNKREVLLATAMVILEAPKGQLVVRALLDQGSQVSIMSESVVQQLGLQKKKINAKLVGIGETNVRTNNTSVESKLVLKDGTKLHVNAIVMSNLGSLIPSRYLSLASCDELKGLQLADPQFDKTKKVDILLGADIYAEIILGNIRKLSRGPIAQETKLGWIITGQLTPVAEYRSYKVQIENFEDLNHQLKQFWELEEIPHSSTEQPQGDIECEEHFERNTTRNIDGRYMVRLPFKSAESKDSLGNSRESAEQSFKRLERRFESNKQFKKDYTECLQEYIESGHMEQLDTDERNNGYYLPHHAVTKESSTTKTRVVFDASRKTTSGVSLNDILLTGPSININLMDVILRWRMFRYGFSADIARMYRQIRVHPEDCKFQKILWRTDTSESIKGFRLNTVTFGTTCAPYLAMRTLKKLANDEQAKYRKAHNIVMNNFYVDDVLAGGDTLQEAIDNRKQISELLANGGFKLRKWVANDIRILEGVEPDDIDKTNIFNLDHLEGVKSLGIVWMPASDFFTYRIKSKEGMSITKRSILSDIARLFDPMGWLAPITVTAKILLQSLWLIGLKWDDPLPNDIKSQWALFKQRLPQLENLKIPRYVEFDSNMTTELHGFSDASKDAYAAVIYLVTRKSDSNETYVHLLAAKTKVTPLKTVTIPRLELCGAVLLSKLMKWAINTLTIQATVHLWTDSTIVLAWIRQQPHKLPIFVANRTRQILENVGSGFWNYVNSTDNPADLASRGMDSQKIAETKLWWSGPSWLQEPSPRWPITDSASHVDLEETVDVEIGYIHHQIKESNCWDELLARLSSLTRLERVTAHCLRFTNILLKRPHTKGFLTTKELRMSREFWIKRAQQEEFASELNQLQSCGSVDSKSQLRNLHPFLDGNNILRVGGRLVNSDLASDAKTPIIIPKRGLFTDLLVRHIHEISLHGSPQLMLNTLRLKYWLIDGRRVVKHHVHKCIKCFRAKSHTSSQLMGNLPRPRVTITRPFTHTGVDYCGPFLIRDRNGRGCRTHKGYVVIFICFAVKAVHIELANDLSAQSFLAALTRFTGRRGLCSYLYSDCGTNFIGANNELQRIFKTNGNKLSEMGITWKFNPPASPHFGGLWEAGVRSIKHHLRRIVGDVSLTYEELSTTLVQIERCLNSRPLCPLTDDPTDAIALTPAHFLIGDNLLATPEIDLTELNINYLTRWQLTQRLSQNFWRRWKKEYLTTLQHRPKWHSTTTCPKVGALCLVKDERSLPYRWPLGRIVELHPGNDSLPRVVSVKLDGTIFKRPITKIILLPID